MLKEQTAKIGKLESGKSVLTKAYKLPADYIIHTVGPVWTKDKGSEKEILKSCYMSALKIAKEHGFESIAFPLISSGVYGCPKDVALSIAVSSVGEFLLFNDMMVYLVVYDKKAYKLSENLYVSVKEYIDDNYIDEHFLQRTSRIQKLSDCLMYQKSIFEPSSMKTTSKHKGNEKSLEDVISHMDETLDRL